MRTLTTLIFSALTFGALAQSTGDFRSAGSGSWTINTNWERFDGSSWVTAPSSPTSADGVIAIQSGHTMDIAGSLTIDQTVIESGGKIIWNTSTLTINDGAGVDLDVQGAFEDNSTTSVTFSPGATWQLGTSGSILRTSTGSSNNWQSAYAGGIASIPASSNWILRKTSASTPSITSISSYFGNLILENTSGSAWSTSGNSNFQGSSGYPTIKGDFDIGGTISTTPISFFSTNTNASPVVVQGNLIVGATHTLTNSTGGRGFEVYGSVTVDGTLDDDGGGIGFGLLRFAGGNYQPVSGGGTILIREMVVNKSGSIVDLQRDLSPNNLTLNNGNAVLNSYMLTIPPSGVITGGSASSYVTTNSTGSLYQTVGATATGFPVGKSGYNPVTLSNSGTSDVFGVRIFDEVWSGGAEGSGGLLTSNIVNKTWDITESVPGGSNINMTVQWTGGDELPGFTRSACYISHHDGTGWGAGTPGPATGAGPYTRSRSGLTDFSPFAVASSGALPIELSRFAAQLQHNKTHLDWTTASETNNSHFAIERSADGRVFSEIGRINGAGTVRERREYTYTDNEPLRGPNYYRLRQVDYDGQFAFSPVRLVFYEADAMVLLYPSPADNVLHLQWKEPTDGDVSWEIFDSNGRMLVNGTQPARSAMLEIAVSPLQPGAYWIRLTTDRQSWSQAFVKR